MPGLRQAWEKCKRELHVYRRLLQHPRTPRLAKVILGLAVAYALSPIDLIPDWVPVLGYLDDLLIVPGFVALALWLIPRDIVEDCRKAAEER